MKLNIRGRGEIRGEEQKEMTRKCGGEREGKNDRERKIINKRR